MGIKLRAAPKFHVDDNNGDPAVGWKVHTYEPGTLVNKHTYTDNAQTATNANPVILDARGEADIWWDGVYKVVVKDDADVVIYTVDNYGSGEELIVTTPVNLLLNGSFEIDTNEDGEPDEWTITEYSPDGVIALDDTTQSHGAQSLKFTSIGNGGGIADSDTYIECTDGEYFRISFNYKSSVVDVRNVVEIQFYTSAKALISSTTLLDDSATNPTSWTLQKYEAVLTPPTARYAKLKFTGCHASDATVGSTWFDDVRILRDVNGRGAYVYETTGASWTPGSGVAVPFDNEVYDTDGIHDNATNNTRLTVPEGVRKIRLTGYVWFDSSTATGQFFSLQFAKGGTASFLGNVAQQVWSSATNQAVKLNIVTGVLEVDSGEYFELVVDGAVGTSFGSSATPSNFSMEIIE